jgi:hypothetical protein
MKKLAILELFRQVYEDRQQQKADTWKTATQNSGSPHRQRGVSHE